MALLCVVAAYNEEGQLGDCIRSAFSVGADAVHVFDGAWRAGDAGPGFAGARRAPSTDATAEVARANGAVFHRRSVLWPHQGAKRTAMFHRCGARRGDHLLVLDADERATGRVRGDLPAGHLNVLLRSIGPNDLPGVRALFPRGDYSIEPRPALRLFAWVSDLTCICPGHYIAGGRRIDPYDGARSRLELVEEVCIEHHANLRGAERIAAKRAYYAADHPTRDPRVVAALRALRPKTIRGGQRMQKLIADRRIYGYDGAGRRVLVAAPGQPVPEGFGEPMRPKPAAGGAGAPVKKAGGGKRAGAKTEASS